jgi:hypothetical protein
VSARQLHRPRRLELRLERPHGVRASRARLATLHPDMLARVFDTDVRRVEGNAAIPARRTHTAGTPPMSSCRSSSYWSIVVRACQRSARSTTSLGKINHCTQARAQTKERKS